MATSTHDNAETVIQVDVVSDVMCPWCYIGQKHLEQAIEEFGSRVEVHWRPYQLDPTLPKEGKDRQTYLNEKFGGAARSGEIYQNIENAGKNIGIDFQFYKIPVSPNTLDAHRLIRWAGGVSPQTQSQLVERLFETFFLEGGNIGANDVLTELAEEVGMDGKLVRELLSGTQDKNEVEAEINTARRMGVTGVPCFIVDNQHAVMGAQPPEIILQMLQQAVEAKQK